MTADEVKKALPKSLLIKYIKEEKRSQDWIKNKIGCTKPQVVRRQVVEDVYYREAHKQAIDTKMYRTPIAAGAWV